MSDHIDNNSIGNNSETLLGEEPYHYDSFPDDDMQSMSTEYSENDEFSVIKNNKKNKKNKKSNKKKDDKGYRKIKGKEGSKFEYFASGTLPGSMIRDPINGHHIVHHRVGSTDEDLYFKVTYIGNGVKEPDQLYYDNPEQAESHMNCNINTNTKHLWSNKYQFALQNMEKAN